MAAENEHIALIIKSVPSSPGIYQFFDTAGNLIYVGKAKNLKKRVSSYFTKTHDNAKTRIMVGRITDIRHIVVDSEADALLLENNLIKKHQPRYNVMLKDDKTFPWLCVKNERFPRIFKTRNPLKDGSVYFGPYTSGMMVRTILDLIRQLYPMRTCNYKLSDENIKSGKLKVCLEYHIGNCLAPCIGNQTEDEYNRSVEEIKNILKGNIQTVQQYLKKLMLDFASHQQFEEAQKIKEKIEIIDNYRSKSTIVNPAINNVDVFSITGDEKNAWVNYIRVVNGAVIQAHTIEIKKKLDEKNKELLPLAITDIRQRLFSNSREIIVPYKIDVYWPGVKITVPRMGDKKKLLDLSVRNALYYRKEMQQQKEALAEKKSGERKLTVVRDDLRLKELPVHIECFDNSNIQGTNPVAACVVFRNIKPSKKDYRKYNIKTVSGPDDYASMEEVVYRRYRRLVEEEQSLPQLIIIDGGKGQLNAAVKALKKLNLYGKIAILSIAKKLEELYYPGDPVPLYLDKNSETLRLIQHIRNEAHRFGISFHRDKRSKQFISSELENIRGIGDKSIELLLGKFGSVQKIRNAGEKELAAIVGNAKARLITDYLKATE
ncbi:MAG: excinuclease ABC subunit UvrC [Bacteroidota bacterium]